MKGLTTLERDLIKFMIEAPPSACDGPGAAPFDADRRAAVLELVKQGRAALVHCDRCQCKHVAVTPDGLMAYRLDSESKPGLP